MSNTSIKGHDRWFITLRRRLVRVRCWFLGHRPISTVPTDRWNCAHCANGIASFYKYWRRAGETPTEDATK